MPLICYSHSSQLTANHCPVKDDSRLKIKVGTHASIRQGRPHHLYFTSVSGSSRYDVFLEGFAVNAAAWFNLTFFIF